MASTTAISVLPLWRIHNFSSKSAGDTVGIINIARPDTIALLHKLSGDHGPYWAAGKIALAANYSTEPATLKEATLVRIKKVTLCEKPGVYGAELLVLCQARVLGVSTMGPFPTAKRGQDLAPLWKIHHLGFVGDPSFDTKRKELNVVNIGREDSLAMLKKLGGGDLTSAKGHLVLACDFTANVKAGLRALLVRIGDVSCAEDGKHYNCTLHLLGHVRCAEVYCQGPFPQVLVDEIPVWRIHNLNKSGGGPRHSIVNIARPDSVALLTHLGQGNALKAYGGLVIGCDYTSPPSAGESGRLMEVASISRKDGKYEAVLVDVSTVAVSKYRSSEGQAEDWWPRVMLVLPKIWSKSAEPAVVESMMKSLMLSSGKCPYWEQCLNALTGVMRDAGIQLDKRYTDPDGDECFCHNCHQRRGDGLVYKRGGQPYVVPVGFARIGIQPGKSHGLVEKGMKSWHVCFHGTKYQYMGEMLLQGQLLGPGCVLHNGESIKTQDGHIVRSFNRRNEHTGKLEEFDPTNKVFFSPSIKYCDCDIYANKYYCNGSGRHYRFVMQLRIQPNTYDIGQETINASGQIDPHIPNKSIEWYTNHFHTHFFTGILIREL